MKPIGKNILVELIDEEKEGLIEIPDTVLARTKKARVVKLGTGERGFEFTVKENNIILIDMSMTVPVTWDGPVNNRYIVIETEILALYDNIV